MPGDFPIVPHYKLLFGGYHDGKIPISGLSQSLKPLRLVAENSLDEFLFWRVPDLCIGEKSIMNKTASYNWSFLALPRHLGCVKFLLSSRQEHIWTQPARTWYKRCTQHSGVIQVIGQSASKISISHRNSLFVCWHCDIFFAHLICHSTIPPKLKARDQELRLHICKLRR